MDTQLMTLERQRRELRNDLEQLQKTRDQALKELDRDLYKKRIELQSLDEEGKRLSMLCRLLAKSIDDMLPLIKDFGKKELDTANERLKIIHGDIEVIKKALIDRENDLNEREKRIQEWEEKHSVDNDSILPVK